MIAAFVITLFVTLFLSVPIVWSLALASIVGMLFSGLPLIAIPQQIFNNLNSFSLMAVPFFILSGDIMIIGGMSKRLVDYFQKIVGNLPGGLAIVSDIASMFFAAISGSSTATTAAIGGIMMPEMIKKGYDPDWVSVNQATAGALGMIIPPSIALIMYGVSAGVSIGDLFLAGFTPGIFIGLSLIIYAYYMGKKHGWQGSSEKRATFKELVFGLKDAILAILMPLIVLGGIYAGIFTPTESAVVAVVYSFIISAFVYKELNFKKLIICLEASARTTAVIMIVIGTAGSFGYFLAYAGIPDMVTNGITSITSNAFTFLMVVNILLLIVGMFINSAAAILILTPLLVPVAITYNVNLVHFGIIMIVNLAIGFVTPPLGMDLFVSARISGRTIVQMSKALPVFMVLTILDLMVITYWPALSMFIPNLLK